MRFSESSFYSHLYMRVSNKNSLLSIVIGTIEKVKQRKGAFLLKLILSKVICCPPCLCYDTFSMNPGEIGDQCFSTPRAVARKPPPLLKRRFHHWRKCQRLKWKVYVWPFPTLLTFFALGLFDIVVFSLPSSIKRCRWTLKQINGMVIESSNKSSL